MSVAQVAKLFGITKTAVYHKIYKQKAFNNVFRVGGNPNDPHGEHERPFLLLLKSEVHAVKESETARRNTVSPEQQVREWNRRVKDWGRQDGRFGPIHPGGRPVQELKIAYEKAHPDDPFPGTEPATVR